MNDGELLLRAVVATPEEDTPRLMYADWLEESGDPERAEFIRDQVEFRPGGRDYDLLNDNWGRWFPDVARRDELGFTRDKRTGGLIVPLLSGNTVFFFRGFVGQVWFGRTESFFGHAERGYWGNQPIASVRLLDKYPMTMDNGDVRFWWGNGSNEDILPSPLYDVIVLKYNKGNRHFTSASKAFAAVSAACVDHGRDCAGLPLLTPAADAPVPQGS